MQESQSSLNYIFHGGKNTHVFHVFTDANNACLCLLKYATFLVGNGCNNLKNIYVVKQNYSEFLNMTTVNDTIFLEINNGKVIIKTLCDTEDFTEFIETPGVKFMIRNIENCVAINNSVGVNSNSNLNSVGTVPVRKIKDTGRKIVTVGDSVDGNGSSNETNRENKENAENLEPKEPEDEKAKEKILAEIERMEEQRQALIEKIAEENKNKMQNRITEDKDRELRRIFEADRRMYLNKIKNTGKKVPLMFLSKHPIFEWLDQNGLLESDMSHLLFREVYYSLYPEPEEVVSYYTRDVFRMDVKQMEEANQEFGNDIGERMSELIDKLSMNKVDVDELVENQFSKQNKNSNKTQKSFEEIMAELRAADEAEQD